ncbi:MAG TPA: NifU family protein [Vicinamibacteria bacterium]|nr:NifU family protein [Vicinamibacteria bacterium]
MAVLEEREFQRRIQKIEGLVHTLESVADPKVRASAKELVQSLLDLHGAGLDRILTTVSGAGEPGRILVDELARDDLVSSLLLLHGLHPVGLEERVKQALEEIGPHLRSHGGSVEMVGLSGSVVRLRLSGGGHGCGSSPAALQVAVEDAVYAAAPDVEGVQVEAVLNAPAPSGLVQLQASPSRR